MYLFIFKLFADLYNVLHTKSRLENIKISILFEHISIISSLNLHTSLESHIHESQCRFCKHYAWI